MILTCPSCETRYEVDASAFPPAGRTVRCAKCGNSWTEKPPQDMPLTVEVEAPAAVPEPAPPPPPPPPPPAPEPTEVSFDEAPAPVPEPEPDDISIDIGVPEPAGGGRRVGLIAGWIGLVVFLVGLAAGGIFAQEMIVAAWPPASKLYEMVGMAAPKPGYGLDLQVTGTDQKLEGKKVILIVKGQITNTSEADQPIPKLIGVLFDAKRRELFDWKFAASKPHLAPGEKLEFSTRVPDPPKEAKDLVVTFAAPEPDAGAAETAKE